MYPAFRFIPHSLRLLCLIVVAGAFLVTCGPTGNQPAGGSPYARAKAAFKSGELDKALDLTDKLATTTPPADDTDRARVLRAVIFTGELKSAMKLSDAYSKGAEKAKNPQFEREYRRLHNDTLGTASRAALNLAETAHQIAPQGEIAKQVTVETDYPTTEGPAEVKQLTTVESGGWIEPDQQESAAADALRGGVDDALADVVSGDRAKARQALASGSTQVDGVAFALFLAKELAQGGVVFDRKHGRDAQRLMTLCNEGEATLKAAQAALKDTPNKDEDQEVKKLQDKFKALRKESELPLPPV